MWFKRDWELIDKTILPSGYEQMGDIANKKIKMDDASNFFTKTLVLTFKCKITGKVKIEVVRS